jgi:hypothetical protein
MCMLCALYLRMPGSAGRGVSRRPGDPDVNVVLSGEACYVEKLGVANANIQTAYAQCA